MTRIALIPAFLAAVNAVAQTPAKEQETMQALLTEVRQLRQAIEGMTGASQRVQIALYSLQMQDAAATRAAQRLEGERGRCSALESDKNRVTTALQDIEAAMVSRDAQTKDFTDHRSQMRRELEMKSAELRSCQASEAEATTQFRSEQAKLTELQDRIARLDKALERPGTDGR